MILRLPNNYRYLKFKTNLFFKVYFQKNSLIEISMYSWNSFNFFFFYQNRSFNKCNNVFIISDDFSAKYYDIIFIIILYLNL